MQVPSTFGESLFILAASQTGYEPIDVEVELKDTFGVSSTLTFKFAVCGEDYWDPVVCTIPKKVEEVEEVVEEVEEEESVGINPKPELVSEFLGGLTVPDKWADFVTDPNAPSLRNTEELGTASDPEDEEVTVSTKVPKGYSDILIVTVDEANIALEINMKALYESSIDLSAEVSVGIEITLDDGTNQVEVTIPVKFEAKPEKEEEEPLPESEPEETEVEEEEEEDEDEEEEEEEEEEVEEGGETLPPFEVTFDFGKVKPKKAKNKPVKVAKGKEDKSERKAPQIS